MRTYLFLLFFLFLTLVVHAQNSIQGKVEDENSNEPLAGVNIYLENRSQGTISDSDGNFTLDVSENPPFVLMFSIVGYQTQKLTIENNTSLIKVKMKEQTYLGDEVIVSASRVEENVLLSPVSVEKMDIRDINSSPTASFYDALANIKGVDMNVQSFLFKFPTTRGFNGETNYRVNQLIDGIDNAPPGLSFAAGNIFGLNPLDVESVELIMGASSALYGPGGMNGTILMTGKNPFDYQGLSASLQTGIMNLGSDETSPTPMVDFNFRYAKAISKKLAFKVTAGYIRALDWVASDYRNRIDYNNPNIDPYTNPGYDGVNVYGDDVIVPVNLKDQAPIIADGAAQEQNLVPGTPEYDAEYQRIINLIPDQLVTRTGYKEKDLIDYNTENLRGTIGLNYRLNSATELAFNGGFARGSSVYTAQNRFALKNFQALHGKIELKNNNYFLRAWATNENAGDTYDLGSATLRLNEEWKSSEDWYTDYIGSFVTNHVFFGNSLDISYNLARATADNRYSNGNILSPNDPVHRPLPGEPEFDSIWNELIAKPVNDGGALVIDHSSMYQFEGMYDFSHLFKSLGMQFGASYRLYSINTNGTVFFDKPGEPIYQSQYGMYGQLIETFFSDRLKLTLSGRYDKNSKFEGQITPRMSAVYSLDKDKTHNVRCSAQTAFRFASTADQWVDLSLGELQFNGTQFDFRVIGGNEEVQQAYGLRNNPVFALSGNNPFTGTPESEPYSLPIFRPETVQALEIGYKGLYMQKLLMVDAYFYHNTYDGFHAKQALVLNPGGASENRFITTISSEEPVVTYGWALGIDSFLPGGYLVKTNISNNSLDENSNQPEGYQTRFNTPKNRLNISLANYHVVKNIGFNISWHWQQSYLWQSDFGTSTIPAYNTLDAQLSVKLPKWSSVVKVGGANILNQYYTTGLGNASIGGLYYVQVTFDEFLN
ncbi:MAG: carboxypeptidase-like regulatory domain-containing protein [Cyclobacteriaceae bacterium]|nr:carboxypeptidase-like regulatory domain-containing protein [Cyclobacteriaceae bacterium]